MIITTMGNCLASSTCKVQITLLVMTSGVASGKSTAMSQVCTLCSSVVDTTSLFINTTKLVSRTWMLTQSGQPSSTYPPHNICGIQLSSYPGAFSR